MHLNVKISFVGKTCRKWANGLKIDDSETRDPRGLSAPTRGNIHVYYSDIERSFSLKPLGQSKLNFMWSILRKSE